jgi:hypothetical protein
LASAPGGFGARHLLGLLGLKLRLSCLCIGLRSNGLRRLLLGLQCRALG